MSDQFIVYGGSNVRMLGLGQEVILRDISFPRVPGAITSAKAVEVNRDALRLEVTTDSGARYQVKYALEDYKELRRDPEVLENAHEPVGRAA